MENMDDTQPLNKKYSIVTYMILEQIMLNYVNYLL
jgi:hypothetical protein